MTLQHMKNPADVLRQLDKIGQQKREVLKSVKAKRRIRESERAMWIMDLNADLEALEKAAEAVAQVAGVKAGLADLKP